MRIRDLFNIPMLWRKLRSRDLIRRYRKKIQKSPLDAKSHYRYASGLEKHGLNNIAHAEYRNAKYLGFDKERVTISINSIRNKLGDLSVLDTNQYERFDVLRHHLDRLIGQGDTILDIGGGHGILSQFMPQNDYFLVEPTMNGISGVNIPFEDDSFDAVVTCHVLEHVPAEERLAFIDELIRVSRRNVLVFNPFKSDLIDDDEITQLAYDVTQSVWAREHLECGLPQEDEIREHIEGKGLSVEVTGYGDIYASMSASFMSYFALEADSGDRLEKINQYMNLNFDHLTCGKYPTNLLMLITK